MTSAPLSTAYRITFSISEVHELDDEPKTLSAITRAPSPIAPVAPTPSSARAATRRVDKRSLPRKEAFYLLPRAR